MIKFNETVNQLLVIKPNNSPTCLFNLGFPRLGGGHNGCGGLCDATGRLLQTVQVGAVFVCFYLRKRESKKHDICGIGTLLIPVFLQLC